MMEHQWPRSPAMDAPLYCGVCTLPVEYCRYGALAARCRDWLRDEDEDEYVAQYGVDEAADALAASTVADAPAEPKIIDDSAPAGEASATGEDGDGKHQSRGGKALVRDDAKRAAREEEKRRKARVTVTLVDRNKRKSVTHVGGLSAFGLDMKRVAKRLAGKYACGCSVVTDPAGGEEIVVQGDVVDDVMDFLPSEYPEIPAAQIDFVNKSKR